MNDLSNTFGTAKLFWTGRSQAVRLPKQFRFEGKEVRISGREDGSVLLEPIAKSQDDWIERVAGKMDDDCARIILEERPGPETMPEWAHLR